MAILLRALHKQAMADTTPPKNHKQTNENNMKIQWTGAADFNDTIEF